MTELGYDTDLVIGSVLVVILTCYATLAVEQLLFHSLYAKYKKLIIVFGGAVLGMSVWCMHFVGILAYQLPISHHFDFSYILLSYLSAFLASTAAIGITARRTLSVVRIAGAAIILAIGGAFMHYLGILGLLMPQYEVSYKLLFVLVCMVTVWIGAGISLWVAYKLRKAQSHFVLLRGFATLIMAVSVIGMHYTAMMATEVHQLDRDHILAASTSNEMLVFSIIFILCITLMVIVFISLLELRLADRNQQLHEMNKKLVMLAMHDSLTKLPNRSYLIDYAKMVLSEHRLHRQSFALLYIDLDRFKSVNDAFGHHIGDEILTQFSGRVTQCAEHHKLFRISGDEFLLVAEHVNVEQSERLAQDIVNSMQHGFKIGGHTINMTASVGIAMFPEHGDNLQELLMHADIAMLLSKEQGRNSFSLFSFNAEQYIERHQSKLINDLFSAIEEKQFILFYQPKFNQKKEVCGVEALIRWQHPTLGLLGPNVFIPLAEKTGLIISIGYWVLEQACKQIQEWNLAGKNFYPIAINLSTIQVEHKHLITKIQENLEKYEVKPDHLIIEITESTAMHHIDSSIRIFQKIRNLGLRLSIDDFGTGHSSFLYLKDLPVDEIKIDRGFIRNLHVASKDELILESIIQLTQNLGLTITAEGIETQEQFEILNRLGCEKFQGFLLGKPVPKEVLEIQFSKKEDFLSK